MGPLIVPTGASIYIDANVLIYSVERVQPYVQALDPFWQDVSAQQAQAVTSQLTALEVLIGPLKAGDTALEQLFRQALFSSPDLRLVPVSLSVLERAAHLRATLSSLKTPDAIHAAHRADRGLRTPSDQRSRLSPGSRSERDAPERSAYPVKPSSYPHRRTS